MKSFFAILMMALAFSVSFGQNEQSPITEKSFDYKDWTYKTVKGGGALNLRNAAAGKKLVLVVYFAPWCPNWKHDAAFVQGLYEKYKRNGFEVIGVGEYDPVDAMKSHLDANKLTFPAVYESDARTAKDTTPHASYRKAAGDTRKWGSPWYLLLEPATFEKSGELLTKRANVVNGELIKIDAEKFIRFKLGLPMEGPKTGFPKIDSSRPTLPNPVKP